jgi:DNA-binding transcriptional ArsR family regulator
MKENDLDLLIHPIRLRIVRVLWQKQQTIAEIAASLPDVPQATLYRHVNKLAHSGILAIVAEHRVRGTVEKVYSLKREAATVTWDKIKNLSPENHLRHFTAFVATMLSDFSRYLSQNKPVDFSRDLVAYRQVPLFLSNDELKEISQKINVALKPFLGNLSKPERRLRVLSTMIMPIDPQKRSSKNRRIK